MANKPISNNKINGIFYTPPTVAMKLVEPLISDTKKSIFDPAYGDGALILAAEQVFWERYKSREKGSLFGCDLSPQQGKTKHLLDSNFVKCDFFDYQAKDKFDVIVMNPPYVRHHYLHADKVSHYQDIIRNVFPLKRTSDLWSYFIVKATVNLKDNGSMGAILPWSFLQADYSVEIRKWLLSLFREIKVLALGANLFDDAKERVVLVWMKGYGAPNKEMFLGTANYLNDDVRYHAIPKEYFTRNRVNISFSNDPLELGQRYKSNYGFCNFSDYADIAIGVVTGADNFFIKHKEKINAMKLDLEEIVPIFTNSAQLRGFSINGNVPENELIVIKKKNELRLKDYLKYGESENYHLRAHSQRREPWYAVRTGNIPDAFFPYRASLIPYLVLNTANVQCTNSIHRIYFRNVKPLEKKWIQVSLLSIPGQLSLEANSRVYGSGVLKIEPNSLKNALCYVSKDRSINKVYSQISRLLLENKRKEAMKIATEFMQKKLRIDKQLIAQSEATYEELLSNRKKSKQAKILRS